jgi:hypothetical protein
VNEKIVEQFAENEQQIDEPIHKEKPDGDESDEVGQEEGEENETTLNDMGEQEKINKIEEERREEDKKGEKENILKERPKEKKKKKEKRIPEKEKKVDTEEELFEDVENDISDDELIFSMDKHEVPKSKFTASQGRKAKCTGPCPVPGTIYTSLIHKSFNAGRTCHKIADNTTVTFHCRQFHFDKVYNA